MAKTNFPNTSFMNLFKSIIYDKSSLPNPTLDLWDAWVIDPVLKEDLKNFTLYNIKSGDTWVGLATRLYGDARLWWMLPLFNNIEDPFIIKEQDIFNEGVTQIKILSRENIDQILFVARREKIINDENPEEGT